MGSKVCEQCGPSELARLCRILNNRSTTTAIKSVPSPSIHAFSRLNSRALLQGKLLNSGVCIGGTAPRGFPLGHPRVTIVGSACTAIAEPVRLGYRPISLHVIMMFNLRIVWGIRAPRDFHTADAVECVRHQFDVARQGIIDGAWSDYANEYPSKKCGLVQHCNFLCVSMCNFER